MYNPDSWLIIAVPMAVMFAVWFFWAIREHYKNIKKRKSEDKKRIDRILSNNTVRILKFERRRA